MAAADSFKFLEQAILENLNCVQEVLAIYGAYHVLKHLIKLPMLLKPFYTMSKCKNDLKAKFGSYAVISSIEQELGREIAYNLAMKGINLIVFYDEEHDHTNVAFISSLRTNFNIEILTVNLESLKLFNRCLDNESKNSNNASEQKDDILQGILRKDIGILCVTSDYHQHCYQQMQMNKFLSHSDQEIDKLIYTNIITPLKLQKLFFRKLVERERGLVLSVASSIVTHSTTPYLSLYAASKQFCNQLNNSIEYEYSKHHNIQFKTLILTYFTSYLFENEINEDKAIKKQNDKGLNGLLNKFIIRLLPSKQRFITSLLESNCSTKTAGHWLLNLEFYLTDNLPQFMFNLILELIFLKNN